LFGGRGVQQLEQALPSYVAARRWYAGKAGRIKSVDVLDAVAVPAVDPGATSGADPVAYLLLLAVDTADGQTATYTLPIAYAEGQVAEELVRWHPEAVVADLRAGNTAESASGVLYDAVWDPSFARSLVEIVARRRHLPGRRGRLQGSPAPTMRRLVARLADDAEPTPMSAEQSNSSIAFDSQLIVKLLRRVEPGVHPGIEMSRFLAERARFTHTPLVGGSLEYRPAGNEQQLSLVSVEEYVPNEGDGFSFVVDLLTHGLEELLAGSAAGAEPPREVAERVADLADEWVDVTPERLGEQCFGLVGPHLDWAVHLGRRTAEMHGALASEKDDPDFAPEPLTAIDRQAMAHGARALAKRSFRQARPFARQIPEVAELLARDGEVLDQMRRLASVPVRVDRIRVHGDYHLGQVLWTGKDFVIVDFEGEPNRSLGQRRLKRPALVDVAGMIRSFHYAARSAALQVQRGLGPGRDLSGMDPWLGLWFRGVTGTFLHAYLEEAAGAPFLPGERDALAAQLDFLLLEKAAYELGYEAGSRPDWIAIPAQGLLDLLERTA
ncbi:MAG TPA: putative maltokinase, partial [Acidimicrobiales bacterium]|nr:putative maltokinase [Acidimicrobiales bacterium]